MDPQRRQDLVRFNSLLDGLEDEIGGARKLADCSGRMPWPARGVYFFREGGEVRSDSGSGPRIVRVGTHALKAASGVALRSSKFKLKSGIKKVPLYGLPSFIPF